MQAMTAQRKEMYLLSHKLLCALSFVTHGAFDSLVPVSAGT